MKEEDKIIRQFLQQEELFITAPEGFTDKVMKTVLAPQSVTVKNKLGDWIYALVVFAALTAGFVVYLIFNKSTLTNFFVQFQTNIQTFFNTDVFYLITTDWFAQYSFSSFWVGVGIIPILLLILDKLISTKWMKTNLFIIG